jgi:transposase
MGEVTTIGLDFAKHVFQVHGVDAEGATVLRKQLRRAARRLKQGAKVSSARAE